MLKFLDTLNQAAAAAKGASGEWDGPQVQMPPWQRVMRKARSMAGESELGKVARVAQERFNEASGKQIAKDIDALPPVISDVVAGGVQGAGGLTAAAARVGDLFTGQDSAGDLLRTMESADRELYARQRKRSGLSDGERGWITDNLQPWTRGTARSFLQMAAGGPAGLAGMAGVAGLTEGNSSYTQAIDQGMSPAEAFGYGASQAAIETGITLAMNKLLGGGIEQQALDQLKRDATDMTMKRVFAEFGKNTLLQELPEEFAVELGHAIAESASSMDPKALTAESLAARAWDTFGQTVMMGGVTGTVDAKDAMVGAWKRSADKKSGRIFDEMEANKAASRSQWRRLTGKSTREDPGSPEARYRDVLETLFPGWKHDEGEALGPQRPNPEQPDARPQVDAEGQRWMQAIDQASTLAEDGQQQFLETYFQDDMTLDDARAWVLRTFGVANPEQPDAPAPSEGPEDNTPVPDTEPPDQEQTPQVLPETDTSATAPSDDTAQDTLEEPDADDPNDNIDPVTLDTLDLGAIAAQQAMPEYLDDDDVPEDPIQRELYARASSFDIDPNDFEDGDWEGFAAAIAEAQAQLDAEDAAEAEANFQEGPSVPGEWSDDDIRDQARDAQEESDAGLRDAPAQTAILGLLGEMDLAVDDMSWSEIAERIIEARARAENPPSFDEFTTPPAAPSLPSFDITQVTPEGLGEAAAATVPQEQTPAAPTTPPPAFEQTSSGQGVMFGNAAEVEQNEAQRNELAKLDADLRAEWGDALELPPTGEPEEDDGSGRITTQVGRRGFQPGARTQDYDPAALPDLSRYIDDMIEDADVIPDADEAALDFAKEAAEAIFGWDNAGEVLTDFARDRINASGKVGEEPAAPDADEAEDDEYGRRIANTRAEIEQIGRDENDGKKREAKVRELIDLSPRHELIDLAEMAGVSPQGSDENIRKRLVKLADRMNARQTKNPETMAEGTQERVTLNEYLSPMNHKTRLQMADSLVGELLNRADEEFRLVAKAMNKKGITLKQWSEEDIDENQETQTLDRIIDGVETLLMEARSNDLGDITMPHWVNRNPAQGYSFKDGKDYQDLGKYELAYVTLDEELIEQGELVRTEVDIPTDAPGGERSTMPAEQVFPEPEKQRRLTSEKSPPLTNEQGEAVKDAWRDEVRRVGKEHKAENKNKVVISLFDYSGAWSQPWRDAGYEVFTMDAKTNGNVIDPGYLYQQIEEWQEAGMEIVGVLSACPCTTFTRAGGGGKLYNHATETDAAVRKVWGDWAVGFGKSPNEVNEKLVEFTRQVIEAANPSQFHALENPRGTISERTGLPKAALVFNPTHFGDDYTKETHIFGAFNTDLPTAHAPASAGSKIHKLSGKNPVDKEARSLTPEGFALAFFLANDPNAKVPEVEGNKPPSWPKEGDRVFIKRKNNRVEEGIADEAPMWVEGRWRVWVKFPDGTTQANDWDTLTDTHPKKGPTIDTRKLDVEALTDELVDRMKEIRQPIGGTVSDEVVDKAIGSVKALTKAGSKGEMRAAIERADIPTWDERKSILVNFNRAKDYINQLAKSVVQTADTGKKDWSPDDTSAEEMGKAAEGKTFENPNQEWIDKFKAAGPGLPWTGLIDDLKRKRVKADVVGAIISGLGGNPYKTTAKIGAKPEYKAKNKLYRQLEGMAPDTRTDEEKAADKAEADEIADAIVKSADDRRSRMDAALDDVAENIRGLIGQPKNKRRDGVSKWLEGLDRSGEKAVLKRLGIEGKGATRKLINSWLETQSAIAEQDELVQRFSKELDQLAKDIERDTNPTIPSGPAGRVKDFARAAGKRFGWGQPTKEEISSKAKAENWIKERALRDRGVDTGETTGQSDNPLTLELQKLSQPEQIHRLKELITEKKPGKRELVQALSEVFGGVTGHIGASIYDTRKDIVHAALRKMGVGGMEVTESPGAKRQRSRDELENFPDGSIVSLKLDDKQVKGEVTGRSIEEGKLRIRVQDGRIDRIVKPYAVDVMMLKAPAVNPDPTLDEAIAELESGKTFTHQEMALLTRKFVVGVDVFGSPSAAAAKLKVHKRAKEMAAGLFKGVDRDATIEVPDYFEGPVPVSSIEEMLVSGIQSGDQPLVDAVKKAVESHKKASAKSKLSDVVQESIDEVKSIAEEIRKDMGGDRLSSLDPARAMYNVGRLTYASLKGGVRTFRALVEFLRAHAFSDSELSLLDPYLVRFWNEELHAKFNDFDEAVPVQNVLDEIQEGLMGEFIKAEALVDPTYFVSGMQRGPEDIRERLRTGQAIGAAVMGSTPVSDNVADLLARTVEQGTPLFLDSGMIAALNDGKKDMDWEAVFDQYERILGQIDPLYRHKVTIVAPDWLTKINGDIRGDVEKTHKLQRKYSARVRDMMRDYPVQVIVPIQRDFGDASHDLQRQFADHVTNEFPVDTDRIVVGVPYNKAKWSDEAILKFVRSQKDNGVTTRLHLLGGGKARTAKLWEKIRKIDPNVVITGDATTEVSWGRKQKLPPQVAATLELADALGAVFAGKETMDLDRLQKMVGWHFKGTMAEGAFGAAEMYDALEAAVNIALRREQWSVYHGEKSRSATDIKGQLGDILYRLSKVPGHTSRDGNKENMQQFSTPPSYGFVASWAAGITSDDIVLEPSVGTGSILTGVLGSQSELAQTFGNELDVNRAKLAEAVGVNTVFVGDAEQIANVLPGKMPAPSVVVMNPPFSRSPRMKGKKMIGMDRTHVDQALKVLAPGGRLVAIIGGGIKGSEEGYIQKGVQEWLDSMPYKVAANIQVSGEVYKGYGTKFPTRVVVIDKVEGEGNTTTGFAKDLYELTDLLSLMKVNNERASVERSSAEGAGVDQVSDGRRGSSGGTSSVGTSGTTGGTAEGDRSGRADGQSGDGDTSGQSESVREGDTGGTEPDSTGSEPSGSTVEPDATGVKAGETESKKKQKTKDDLDESSIYEDYQTTTYFEGQQPHPTKLVESAAMNAVDFPKITYTPNLPEGVVKGYRDKDGNFIGVSGPQLETITLAGQAHNSPKIKLVVNDDGDLGEYRRGFLIGDGTGVGKGREVAGVIMDNWRQGRKKAVWLSVGTTLLDQAKGDWQGLEGDTGDLFTIGDTKGDDEIGKAEGVGFTTYASLIKASKNGRRRIDQLIDWLGEDFDGVIAFDEAHKMANGLDWGINGKATETAKVGLELQRRLPNARILYVSATSATEVRNLVYADRLGLWGDGEFKDARDFAMNIDSGGVAAMEMVARDMKALGAYTSRSLSYDGVEQDRIVQELTPEQEGTYDVLARAWQLVNKQMAKAINEANTSKRRQDMLKQQYELRKQTFFSMVLTSMQMPAVIKDMEKQLAAGHSPVLQLVTTGDAALKRELDKIGFVDGYNSLEDVDRTPRNVLMGFVDEMFPTHQYEEYKDEHGNTRMRQVFEKNPETGEPDESKPVHNAEAMRLKNAMLTEIAMLNVPDNPLDQLIDHFGEDMVAEGTGREYRLVYDSDGKLQRQKRPNSAAKKEAAAFMDDEKPIIVFSGKLNTGVDLHSSKARKNQRKRIHYLLEPGWQAFGAMQGLGRTHRSNQAHPPLYILPTTNVKGQARFISTIARRLGQLGALTRGERKAATGVFTEKDNLESPLATAALHDLYRALIKGKIPGVNVLDFEEATDLDLVQKDEEGKIVGEGMLRSTPSMKVFLNRVLAIELAPQNAVMQFLTDTLDQKYEIAKANGTLDQGTEVLKADSIVKSSDQVVHTDPSGAETRYVQLDTKHATKPMPFAKAWVWAEQQGDIKGVYRSPKGKLWMVTETANGWTDKETGEVGFMVKLMGQHRDSTMFMEDVKLEAGLKRGWTKLEKVEARELWDGSMKDVPEFLNRKVHLITGALLPVWKRLPDGLHKVQRLVTDDGEYMLGRVIAKNKVAETMAKLGVAVDAPKITARQAMKGLEANELELILANGWIVKNSGWQGQDWIEVQHVSRQETLDSLKRIGVESMRVNYAMKHYIPMGKPEQLELLMKKHAVVAVNDHGTGTGVAMKPGHQPVANAKVHRPSWKPHVRPLAPKEAPRGTRHVVEALRNMVVVLGKDLGKKMEPVIRSGRLSSKIADGQYNLHTMVIRSKEKTDFPTIVHELAHGIEDWVWGWNANWFEQKGPGSVPAAAKKEIIKLGKARYKGHTPPTGGFKREGWAEFLAMYVLNPDVAAQEAPEMFSWFSDWKAQFPRFEKALAKVQDLSRAYYGQKPWERVGSHMIDPNSFEERMRVLGDFLENNAEKPRAWFREQWIDMFDPIDRAMEKTRVARAARNLDPLTGGADFARLAHFKRMTHHSITDHMFSKGMVGPWGQKKDGGPLTDAIEMLPKGARREFGVYLYARRAIKLLEKVDPDTGTPDPRDPGITYKDALETKLHFEKEYPQFAKAAQKVYEWTDGVLDYVAEASQTMARAVGRIRKTDPGDYVPLKRYFDKLTDNLGTSEGSPGGGAASEGRLMKAMTRKGSAREVIDPLPVLVETVRDMLKTTHDRMVIDAMIAAYDDTPGLGELIEEVPVGQEVKTIRDMQAALSAIKSQYKGGDIDIEVIDPQTGDPADLSDQWVAFFGAATRPTGADGQVIYPIHDAAGNVRWFRIDPVLFDSLEGMDMVGGPPGFLGKTYVNLVRTFRAFTTGARPAFGIVNFLADFQTGAWQSRQNADLTQRASAVLKELAWVGAEVAGNIVNTVTMGKTKFDWRSPYKKLFERLGLSMAQPQGEDQARSRMEKMTRKGLVRRVYENPAEALRAFPEGFSYGLDLLRALSGLSESVTRTTEMRLAMKPAQVEALAALDPNDANYMDEVLKIIDVGMDAAQVTTDFRAAGRRGRVANQYIPFLNAAIQGNRASARQFHRLWTGDEKGLRLALTLRVAQGVALTMLLYALNSDEEWYEELDDYNRYRFWNIPLPGGEMLQVKKGYDWFSGLLSGVEGAFHSIWFSDPEAFQMAMKRVLTDAAPPMPWDSPPFKEALQQAANRDYYFGRPIVPGSMQREEPQDQWNQYTTETAKLISAGFRALPLEIILGDTEEVLTSPMRLEHFARSVLGPGTIDIAKLGEGMVADVKGAAGGKAPTKTLAAVPEFFGYSRVVRRGGPLGNSPKSVQELFAMRDEFKGGSRETPTERVQRMMVTDATENVAKLLVARKTAPTEKAKRDLTKLAAEMAKTAVELIRKGGVTDERVALMVMEATGEGKADRTKKARAESKAALELFDIPFERALHQMLDHAKRQPRKAPFSITPPWVRRARRLANLYGNVPNAKVLAELRKWMKAEAERRRVAAE